MFWFLLQPLEQRIKVRAPCRFQVAEVHAPVGKFPVLGALFSHQCLPDSLQAPELFIIHVCNDSPCALLILFLQEKRCELQLGATHTQEALLIAFATYFLIEFEEPAQQIVDDRRLVIHRLLDQPDDVMCGYFEQKRFTQPV